MKFTHATHVFAKMCVPPCVARKCRVLAAIPVVYLIAQMHRTVSIPVRAMPTVTTCIHIHHICCYFRGINCAARAPLCS